MKTNYINFGTSVFSYKLSEQQATTSNQNQKAEKTINKNVDYLIKKTLKFINNKAHPIKGKDIIGISLSKTNITYTLKNNKQVNVEIHSKKDCSVLQQILKTTHTRNLKITRDLVGEKIMAKAQEKPSYYLYSSGGGGHKSAKDALLEKNLIKLMRQVQTSNHHDGVVEVEVNHTDQAHIDAALASDERLKSPAKLIEFCKSIGLIHESDVLHDYLGRVGKWSSNLWDTAQQAGDVKKQESLASNQWISDLVFGPVVFFSTLKSLIRTKPKKVVSTQAMATPAILFALKVYNKFCKPPHQDNVKLHLYMTDMPTAYSQHFFGSLKVMGESWGSKDLVLHVPKPSGETDWKKLTGIPKEQIKELSVDKLPVRPEFLKAVDQYKLDLENPSVEFKVNEKEELHLLHETLKHQGKDSQLGDASAEGPQFLNYPLKPEDKGYFLMLGSQPTKSAVIDYVKKFSTLAKNNPNTDYHLFAFTGKFDKHNNCFYKELCEYINKQSHWPSNLRVVPLSFQSPKQLVSLELMLDTITRSGGGTSMELLVLNEVSKKNPDISPKKRYIHAQQVEGRSLKDSIPVWEKGNYLFLKKNLGAEVIHPPSLDKKGF